MPKLSFMYGEGPGEIAPDGCAVGFYSQITPREEPDLINSAVPAASDILELGSGAGRITHALVSLGHRVVAVDESADMLAHIKGARTVCSSIEDLNLDQTFDAVILMSFLIEIPDDDLLRAFLSVCRAHVNDSGCVIIERHAPEWHETVEPYDWVDRDGFRMRVQNVDRPAPGMVAASAEYEIGGNVWKHSYLTRRLPDGRLEQELSRAGLSIDSFLTSDRRWVLARNAR